MTVVVYGKDALDKTKGLLLHPPPPPPHLVWHKQVTSKCNWVGFRPSIKLSQSVWDGGGPILKANLIHLRANAHFHIFIPKTRQFADNLLFICNQPPKKKPWIGFACVSCYEIGTRKKLIKKNISSWPFVYCQGHGEPTVTSTPVCMDGGWTRNFFQFPT